MGCPWGRLGWVVLFPVSHDQSWSQYRGGHYGFWELPYCPSFSLMNQGECSHCSRFRLRRHYPDQVCRVWSQHPQRRQHPLAGSLPTGCKVTSLLCHGKIFLHLSAFLRYFTSRRVDELTRSFPSPTRIFSAISQVAKLLYIIRWDGELFIQIFSTRRIGGLCRCACWRKHCFSMLFAKRKTYRALFSAKR